MLSSAIMKNSLARAIKAVMKAKKAIHELDELVDTGFRGPEVLRVTKMIQEFR